jgi:hypothetical protein
MPEELLVYWGYALLVLVVYVIVYIITGRRKER